MTLNLDLGAAGFPFRLQTPPSEAVPHRSWLRAREAAQTALRRGESVALLGRPGTGKTLLLQSLKQALPELLVVDEAGAVPHDELIALCASGKPFVVAALPDTDLPLPPQKVMLDPLSPDEVASVIKKRLLAAGRPVDLFEPAAVVELAKQSGGLMRLVLALAGAATFFAEHEGASRVTSEHVADAAFMRDVARDEDTPPAPRLQPEPLPQRDPAPDPEARRARALVGAALVLLAVAGLWAASQFARAALSTPVPNSWLSAAPVAGPK